LRKLVFNTLTTEDI